MKILISNDDGYNSKGIIALAKILRPYGDLTVVGPKTPQSGMSMAVNLDKRPLAVKRLSAEKGEQWWYLDGTPSSCIKYGLDNVLYPERPDVVVSGINHGANCGTAASYSGTVGAAAEGALAGIPAIAVSLDNISPDADFTVVEELFPPIFEALLALKPDHFGVHYNVNFPNLPAKEVKGVRIASEALLRWEREFVPVDVPDGEEGESHYVMAGSIVNVSKDEPLTDHNLVKAGYISVVPLNLMMTDNAEAAHMRGIGFDRDFH